MSQDTFVRGELAASFDVARLQLVEIQALLKAIHQQDDLSLVFDQLSGVARLLLLLDTDLGALQQRADELEAWAHVTVKQASVVGVAA